MRRTRFWILVLALIAAPGPAFGVLHLVPGPGEPGFDPDLEALALQYDRQFHTFNAAPFGMSLDVDVDHDDLADRGLVEAFLAGDHGTGPDAFLAFSGKGVFDVVDAYGEHGDLGMFGGVAAMGDAYRYALLRDTGAAPARVEEARADLLRAMEALHLCHVVTGTPGVLVRGIRLRGTPRGGGEPVTLPLFDGDGNPYPAEKGDDNYWRDDQSGEHPEYMWLDNTSKDQMTGYFLALAAVYDATHDDPSIPASLKDDLAEDARAIALKLMEVAPETGLDLAIRDADTRLTAYHDLHPAELTPGLVLPGCCGPAGNGFNALLALHIIKTAATLSGDESLEDYYYVELLGHRDFLKIMRETLGLLFLPPIDNNSNHNMAMTAIYTLLRFETDPDLRAAYEEILEALWDHGGRKPLRERRQSLFNLIYAGTRREGVDPTALEEGLQTLREFVPPPYWNAAVVNCTQEEIDDNDCVDLEGNPMPLEYWNDRYEWQSVQPVPKRLRPPSNFEWRSDPYAFNGGGGDRLNPGGDFLGAYWLGRFLPRNTPYVADVSPAARPVPDRDGDAVSPWRDNCPATWNPDQLDADGDGVGDACDPSPHSAVRAAVFPGVSRDVSPRQLAVPLALFLLPAFHAGIVRRRLRRPRRTAAPAAPTAPRERSRGPSGRPRPGLPGGSAS